MDPQNIHSLKPLFINDSSLIFFFLSSPNKRLALKKMVMFKDIVVSEPLIIKI